MSPGTNVSSTAKTAPRLRPSRFEDYPQIERLESSHGLLTLPGDHWRDIWRENPLRERLGENWPIGWVLEDLSGRVVGSLANVPTRYVFRGQELIAATGRAWVVKSEYRGVALWLMEEYFFQENADLFINTTVNSQAVEAFSTFGSTRVPLGDWQSAAFWVTNYRGFARSALRIKGLPWPEVMMYPAAAALRLKEALTVKAPRATFNPFRVDEVDSFGPDFDAFWGELVARNPEKLLAVRDAPTLRWHFAGALRDGHVRVLTASRTGLLRAYCILKRQDHPPSGLVRMRLVDYQSLESDVDMLAGLLPHALRRCVADRIHVLEHVGADLPKMQRFDCFAPYRRKLGSWPFFYQAVAPALDAALRTPEVWDPSAFDGDSSL